MKLVYAFSCCLIFGLLLSQLFDLQPYSGVMIFFTDFCLSYIMMEVGLELSINKKEWKRYGKDYLVASLAAAVPWLLCFFYFLFFFSGHSWAEFLLIARFAAPTSSGILFAMLAAAGLSATWVFRKVQILAIFDDIDTILLLIPLQFLLARGRGSLFIILFVVIGLIYLAWRFLNQLRWPASRPWLLFYSAVLTSLIYLIHTGLGVGLEILLPAFVFGVILHNSHGESHKEERFLILDRTVKIAFMTLVGMILPKFELGGSSYWTLALDLFALTLLSNLGKCCPLFFYKDEVSFRERLAVSVGMFPRGEVGAGVLAIAIAYGMGGYVTTVAVLTLAVNLILVGLFIKIVTNLIGHKRETI